jgi:hypothetical protein
MDVRQQNTLIDIEGYLSQLEASLGNVDIRIPAGLRARGAAGESSFVQFLLTWANRFESRRVELRGDVEPELYFERLAERIPGRVAAVVCTSARRANDENDYTRNLKARSERALLDQYYQYGLSRDNIAARTLNVLCADTAGFGEPRTVYQEDMTGGLQVKDIYGFLKLTDEAFSALVQDYDVRRLTVDTGLVRAVASLLFELFSNTHEHARTSFDGKPLRASCRGFQIRLAEAEDRAWRDAAGNYAPLQQYLRGLPALERRNRQLLEISVFDAGPGFAQRLTKRPLSELSIEREHEAVVRCFVKGTSTKSQSRYGQGLPQVINILRARHGFVRLRTGRLSLSRDLSLEQNQRADQPPELQVWTPPKAERNAVAQGTSFTVLMPVQRLQS